MGRGAWYKLPSSERGASAVQQMSLRRVPLGFREFARFGRLPINCRLWVDTYVWEFSVFFQASKTAASVWERQLPLRSMHVPQPSEVSQASALVVSEVQEIARRASGSVPLPF